MAGHPALLSARAADSGSDITVPTYDPEITIATIFSKPPESLHQSTV
jgi:hypothetical protein